MLENRHAMPEDDVLMEEILTAGKEIARLEAEMQAMINRRDALKTRLRDILNGKVHGHMKPIQELKVDVASSSGRDQLPLLREELTAIHTQRKVHYKSEVDVKGWGRTILDLLRDTHQLRWSSREILKALAPDGETSMSTISTTVGRLRDSGFVGSDGSTYWAIPTEYWHPSEEKEQANENPESTAIGQ